jgi:FlaA1/EpsC-like NDP-sugar epimerase
VEAIRHACTAPVVRWLPIDGALWYAAIVLAVWARYDFSLDRIQFGSATTFAVGALLAQAVSGWLLGTYRGHYVAGSFEEAQAVAGITALVGGALSIWAFSAQPVLVPRSTPFVATAISLSTALAARFVLRAYRNQRRQVRPDAERVIIFGAGDAGTQLVRQMLSDKSSPFLPLALIDDDAAKRQLRIHGVRVRGAREQLAEVAAAVRASTVVVALPGADARLLRDINGRANRASLHMLVLPPLEAIIRGRVVPTDLRAVDVEDLLGRHPARLDLRAITDEIAGKRVLVTGAGGSIGSELCRQIHRFGPAELIMLDRDESALHAVQLSITGRALLDGDDTVLADIRDLRALTTVFHDRAPQVVFHAAALKHLPLLETHPLEAWKTNVVGTRNVLEASSRVGVETFVNISTDKAANPTSVLGYSKRLAERLTAAASQHWFGRYVSVRFGNVLGSRGSVLTTFEQQIAAGGPVTVTDPDVTRFFMTISEACQLVLQAAAIGEDGEALVLDMGDPVCIADVARTLIDRSADAEGIRIVFTGLREGEKLHEELFGDDERDLRPRHSLVSHVPVPALSLDAIDPTATPLDAETALEWMRKYSMTSPATPGWQHA